MVIRHYDTATAGARGECIIDGVKRIVLVAGMLVLAACARKNIENKEAIRQAVVEYLSSRQAQTGLDMSTMDVDVVAMTFERDTARATVAFKVKNSDAGMQINYSLDRKADKWVVQPKQENGGGHGVPIPDGNPGGGGALPPGHPSTLPPAPSPKQ